MGVRQGRISVGTFIAASFALVGMILGAGCARITTLDLQLAPPGPADTPDASSAADESTAGLTPPSPGDIVMIGGAGSSHSSIPSAEFFSAATGKFKVTGAMKKARAIAGAVAVPNPTHDVIVFGGMNGHAASSIGVLAIHSTVLNSSEAYNGTIGRFTTVPNPMIDARTGFTATVFPSGPLSGKVLIAGGDDASGPVATAEIFDPVGNTFTAANSTMTDPREFHTATLLNDGTVLLAGGFKDTVGSISNTADIFDPATQKFTPTTGDMTTNRAAHTASLLTTGSNTGKVLLVDGVMSNSGSVTSLVSAELYDPSSGMFTSNGFPTEPRALHTAATLNDGRILISGGMSGGVTFKPGKIKGFGFTSNGSEIYDPVAVTFTCVNGQGNNGCNPSMTSTRAGHTATLITSGPNQGKVLLAGGLGANRPQRCGAEDR